MAGFLRLLVLCLGSAAALAGATAPDCGSRVGGAFVTFSVRGGPPGGLLSDPVVFASAAAEAEAPAAVGLEASASVGRPRLRGSGTARTAPPHVGFGSGRAQSSYTVTQWVEDSEFISNAIMRARGAIREKHGRSPPMIPMFNKVVLGSDCDKQWSWHVDPTDVGGWVDLATEVCDASPEYLEKHGEDWTQSPGRWCPWGVLDVLSVEDRRGPSTRMHVSKQAQLLGEAQFLGEAVVTNMTLPADEANASDVGLNASVAPELASEQAQRLGEAVATNTTLLANEADASDVGLNASVGAELNETGVEPSGQGDGPRAALEAVASGAHEAAEDAADAP